MVSNGLTDHGVPAESADARNPWTAGKQIDQIARRHLAEQERQKIARYLGNSENMLRGIRDSDRPSKVTMNWSALHDLHGRFGIMRDDATLEDLGVLLYQATETLRLYFEYPLGLEKIHVAGAMDRLYKVLARLPAGVSRDAGAKLYDEYLVKIQEKLVPGVIIDHLGEVAKSRIREIMEGATRV